MKLRVIGWTYNDDDLEEGDNGWAARNAIIDEIRAHGYVFSGWEHQEAMGCTPVLNDGKMYCFSQRGWGDVMAEAHGYTGISDYARYSFMRVPGSQVRPKEYFDEDTFTPETDLNERFELEVSQEIFGEAKEAGQIKLEVLPELRYLYESDTLALSCGGQTAEYVVTHIERKRDLS